MHRSLWLLMHLRFKGWGRRMLGGFGSVRGILMMLLAGGFIAMMLYGAFVQQHAGPDTLAKTRAYGPLALIGMCVMQILFSGNERGLYFSPAEVQFLFTAPLTRRQLLAYKVLSNLGVTIFIALFMGAAFRVWSASLPAAIVGVFLLFSFMQLLAMVLNLAGCALGAHAFNRQRQIALAILGVALLAVVIHATGNPLEIGWTAWARDVQDTQIGRIVLFPVRCFFEAFTAERLWPDLAQWTALSLVVLGVMLGVVFLLDAHYLEAAASASERIYARMERLRRGGGVASYSGASQLTLPRLPRWAGAGPLAWRHFMGLLRAWKSLLVYVVVFLPLILFSWLGNTPGNERSAQVSALAVVLPFLSMLLYIGPASLRCDFRADIDRMDLLKALPLSPWFVALGQMLAPALLLTLLSWLILGYLIVKQETDYLLLIAALMIPANFLMIALENLLFLWYPARLTSGAGDFRNFGRQMLIGISRLFLFLVAVSPAAIAGTIAYFLLGRNALLAGAIAWLLATGVCFGCLGLVALAFQRFDVARDVP